MELVEMVSGQPRPFNDAVIYHFDFLHQLGFVLQRTGVNSVEFASDSTVVSATHGRFSGEVQVRIGSGGPAESRDLFSTYEIALTESPQSVTLIPGGPVREPAQIEQAVAQHASWVKRFGASALRNDPALFVRVREARTLASRRYIDNIAANRLRERTMIAWRRKDMAGVVGALREMRDLETVELTPSERSRLRYAERLSNNPVTRDVSGEEGNVDSG